ncbi:MAG: hypothetical protein P4M12_09930 [Gammaproteobacteria bacterium]|nr:hypothetical protein [Gammaproteobacteria bacterium]
MKSKRKVSDSSSESEFPQITLEGYFYQPNAFSLESANYLKNKILEGELEINALIENAAEYYHNTKDTNILLILEYLFFEKKPITYKDLIEFVGQCYESSAESSSNNSNDIIFENLKDDVATTSNLLLFNYLYKLSLADNKKNYDSFLRFVIEPDHHDYLSLLFNKLRELPTPLWEVLFNDVFSLSLNNADQMTLNLLKKVNPDLVTHLKSKLDLRTQEHCKLLESLSTKDAYEVLLLISQFTNGPGNLDEEGAGLMCSYLKEKKQPHHFLPVILSPGDMKNFCMSLKHYANAFHQTHSQPIRQSFIVTGIHWIAGMIKITKDGIVSALFLDSLGRQDSELMHHSDDNDSEDEEYSSDLGTMTYDQVEQFIEAFADLDSSKVHIYVPEIRRQYSPAGCSVFALRDVRKLENFEKYLGNDVFESCAAKETKKMPISVDSKDKFFQIQFCELPLIFMPTAQTRSALVDIRARPPEEQQQKINKKGETALEASTKFFTDSTNLVNTSNEIKLKKWGKVLGTYLLHFIDQHKRLPNKEMNEFYLKAFNARLARSMQIPNTLQAAAASSSSSSSSTLFGSNEAKAADTPAQTDTQPDEQAKKKQRI